MAWMHRTAEELLNVPDPAWPLVLEQARAAGPTVEVLEGGGDLGRLAIESLQVTAGRCSGPSRFTPVDC